MPGTTSSTVVFTLSAGGESLKIKRMLSFHFLCAEFPYSVIQVRRFPVGTVACYKRLDIGNSAKKKTEM